MAPPKKKGTLKAKIAEKEAAKAARKVNANGDDDDDDEYDEDGVLDPREKAKREKEMELNADLNNAADLFGAAALGGMLLYGYVGMSTNIYCVGTSSTELDSLISFQPRTKEDFHTLSSRIIEFLIKRHQNKPLYAAFVEHHARELAMPLKDVEVRKVASGLTTLANEKQKEQRDKASGKKKPKAAAKPVLGAAKVSTKCVSFSFSLQVVAYHVLLNLGWTPVHMTRHWMIMGMGTTSCRLTLSHTTMMIASIDQNVIYVLII